MLVKDRVLFVDSIHEIEGPLLEDLKEHCTSNQTVSLRIDKTNQPLVRCTCDHVPRHPYDYADANLTMDDLTEVVMCHIERISVKRQNS